MSASIKVGNARLLKLADFLETVPRKHFNYNRWVGDGWDGESTDLVSCGTTACALGWAATMPAFRRLGLRLYRDPEGMDGVCLKAAGDPYNGSPIYAADAAEEIFAVQGNEFDYLFTPSEGEEDATPKQVAKKIRRFVADREGAK
jgi:hypothetical protein